MSDIRGEVKEIGFGSQIRSMLCSPYDGERSSDKYREQQCKCSHGRNLIFINAYLSMKNV